MYAELFEAHRVPAIIVGSDLVVRAANIAAARLMGLPTLADTHGADLLSWIPAELVTDKMRDASTVGAWVPLRSRIGFGEGGPECDIVIRRLRRAGPEPLYCLLISISDLNLSAFRQLRGEIHSAQSRAAAEIANRDELAKANDKLKAFSYRASHDISGPLRKIEHSLDLYRKARETGGENLQLLDIAAGSAASLRRLVADLLEYSQVGRANPGFELVDLEELVRHSKSLLDTAACDQDWLTVGPLPRVKCDPFQIGSLVQNLLSNSIKFRDPGRPVRVDVSSRRNAEGATLTFQDNGRGFSADIAHRLFEPFFRAHGDIVGSGIGLASCAEFASNHGWTLSAHGEAGQGARFEIAIPQIDPATADAPEAGDEP